MNQSIRFGPAGSPDSFGEKGLKSMLDMPGFLGELGLDAFEYQCGHGVRISEKSAAQLGEKAKENGVRLSLHAPYYISMSSTDEEKRLGSLRYILDSARAAHHMGADRIVVHTGSCGKISREEALALAMDTMKLALAALDEANLSHIHICPEVMCKTGQLGTLEEVLALCGLDERLIPCVDFGHLNARTFGGLKEYEDFTRVLDAIRDALGAERAKDFHIHFSRIEYSQKGGEKRHLTFEDREFGPDHELLLRALHERGATPTVICESAGTQDVDAICMRDFYRAL